MNNSYITIIKEKRTALSRKRIPLNQNGCTANFRIGVPFEQNLQAGDDVDCVLCAYDTELTYEKLVQVCKQLTETKVPWFATNPDLRCPIDFGMVPDCGSICRMITASVGREPEYIGKPAPGMVYACLEETGCTPKQTLLIGDRIYTDMECGKRAGIDSCLVLTGEASAEEWKNGFRCQSLGKLAGYFS